MNFQRKKKEKLEVSITPMIDVVFLLLIFFMVSTTFNKESELKINLPEATGAEAETIPKSVTLTIDADGTYYLHGEDDLPHELVSQTAEALKQELVKIKNSAGEIPFVLKADEKTPYKFIMTALDVAGQVGFSHLNFAHNIQQKQ
jgi:biopolymer transport protein ExbD